MKRETAGGIGDRCTDDSFTLETTTIATSWADGEGRSARHFLDVQLSPWGQASSGLTGGREMDFLISAQVVSKTRTQFRLPR